MKSYPRETNELVPLTVHDELAEADVADGYQVAVLPYGQRPGPDDWQDCVVDGEDSGFVLDHWPAGVYTVWVMIGTAVVELETFRVS